MQNADEIFLLRKIVIVKCEEALEIGQSRGPTGSRPQFRNGIHLTGFYFLVILRNYQTPWSHLTS